MAKDLVDIFFDLAIQPILNVIFTDEVKGRYGEKLTEKELKKVNLFGRKGKILRNVYIPKENGETSEIDVLFICQKGVFVFESKNYSGWIFGNEKDQYWTVSLSGRQKNRFYNPIKQNRTHLKWLGNYLSSLSIEAPLYSIIVFSERCELKKITVFSDDIAVIKRDQTYKTVRKIWDSSEDKITEDQVDMLYEKLKLLTNVHEAVKEAHIKTIEEKYIAPKEEKICPKCGSKLILRTAKKGANEGNQFYGCSSFPKCRYIENI